MANNRCTQSGKVTVRSGSDCWKPATAPSSNGGFTIFVVNGDPLNFRTYFFPAKLTLNVSALLFPPENVLKLAASVLFTTASGFCRSRTFTASLHAAHR